jgi:hypothetical protein
MRSSTPDISDTANAAAAVSISLLRRNLLRGCFLLLVVGQALTSWPLIVGGGVLAMPPMDGAVHAMLAGLGLVAVLGVLSPERMLPLLIFEITWKVIWVLAVAVPLLARGPLPEGTIAILFACAWAIPFLLVMPWRYVWARYVRRSEPWR